MRNSHLHGNVTCTNLTNDFKIICNSQKTANKLVRFCSRIYKAHNIFFIREGNVLFNALIILFMVSDMVKDQSDFKLYSF